MSAHFVLKDPERIYQTLCKLPPGPCLCKLEYGMSYTLTELFQKVIYNLKTPSSSSKNTHHQNGWKFLRSGVLPGYFFFFGGYEKLCKHWIKILTHVSLGLLPSTDLIKKILNKSFPICSWYVIVMHWKGSARSR